MTENSFLERRAGRAASRQLTQLLVFGYLLGFAALVVGGYRYYLVADANDRVWKAVGLLGIFIILATLAAPSIWKLPERMLRTVGNAVGHALITGLLVVIYYALIWPVGGLLRATKGPHPIYRWGATPPDGMEGWRNKELPADVALSPSRARSRRLGMIGVLAFFIRRGHFLLVPVLLLLISLGVALFFLQTSALAPFIYTLF